jgi:spore photoproduct lyase
LIHTLYIEREIAAHPRVRRICQRFPRATRVRCERYAEVFNPRAQNFRLQKARPALILARKHGRFVLEVPPGYGVGGGRNFYFSHLLNCVYDCRYCFLQGMYRSAHYVLFVNYEDFQEAIEKEVARSATETTWFFSGYDCDSLALEPVTGFAAHFLALFERHPHAWLELRTKSTQTRSLLHREPIANCVVAFSFTPEPMSRALEHKVPSLVRRLETMQRLQRSGWTLGLRFDPLVYAVDYQAQYRALYADVFAAVDVRRLHSVSLGSFRLPRGFFRTIERLYPDEPLFAGPLEERSGTVGYRSALECEMLGFCREELRPYVPEERVFACGQYS